MAPRRWRTWRSLPGTDWRSCTAAGRVNTAYASTLSTEFVSDGAGTTLLRSRSRTTIEGNSHEHCQKKCTELERTSWRNLARGISQTDGHLRLRIGKASAGACA